MASCSDDNSADLRSPLMDSQQTGHDNKKKKMCIDEMLSCHCGEFGRWQLRHFVLTSLAWALEAFHTMVMIFADREPAAWRCVGGAAGCEWVGGSPPCGMAEGSWEWVGGAGQSTAEEWGLICGDKYKIGLVQALFFGGCMIGAGTFGHLSDSFLGRKGSLTIVCILSAIFGILTAFSPNYYFYILLRFLTGFSTGGIGLCAFVLATEPVGPSKRGSAGMSTFYFFSSGIALCAAISFLFPSWRELYIVSAVPSVLFVLLVIPFVSESPRWFLVRGKVNEAMEVMRNIARVNGRSLPSDVWLAVDCQEDQKSDFSGHQISQKYADGDREAISTSIIDVIKCPMTRIRLILAVAINLLCSVVYYGLSLNVVNLGTNLYLSVLLNAVAELPAYTLTAILLSKFGRKPLAISTMWFSGVFCLIGSVLWGDQAGLKAVRLFCGVLGIFGMAGTYNLLFIYTTELFPTVVRNAALGCATQAAQMGAILSPFVVVMGGGVPFAVFAGCGIVGGFLGFYLPETKDRPLYDTLDGMEDGERKEGPAIATLA
ncbi:hypothetical protein QQ045_017241 [Rhodiola kirilowii]